MHGLRAVRTPRNLRTRGSRRLATWGAWCLVALAVALGLGLLAVVVTINRAAAAGTPVPTWAIAGLELSGLGWLKALPIIGEAWGFAALGAVLISRESAPALGWLFCFLGLEILAEYFTDFYALYALYVAAPGAFPGGLVAAWIQHWIWLVGIMLLVAFVPLRFPTGRLVSPRWQAAWWLAVGMTAAGALLLAFAPGQLSNTLQGAGVANPLGVSLVAPAMPVLIPMSLAVLVASILLAAASLIVRLRRAQGVERQQIKWFAYCVLLLALAFVGQTVAQNVLGISSPFVNLASSLGLDIGIIGLPIATGLAILRYRLFDIDVLIRLTLVYGTLTTVLGGAYVAVVVGAQAVMRGLTGQTGQQPAVIVASTLLVAALFTPLRRAIQAAIDRRFYRRKVDAERTLAAFGATLRSEVDLERLSANLLAAAEETMQPAHASLWLRKLPRAADLATPGARPSAGATVGSHGPPGAVSEG